ncbi:MAG: FCD domain-containing protein [Sneathiella sp.]
MELHKNRTNENETLPVAKTATEAAYSAIREDILSGHLPPESRLRVEHLRRDYGVGSSTMREALSRLISDTLVTTEGQRGFRVAPISLADFRQIASMRKLLEAEAITDSIKYGDDEWEAQIVAAFHKLSKVEEQLPNQAAHLAADWENRNQAFHDALVSACSNRWLMHFRKVLYDQSSRYLRISLVERNVTRNVHAEHEALYKAILDRDIELACKLSDQHINLTVDVIADKVSE